MMIFMDHFHILEILNNFFLIKNIQKRVAYKIRYSFSLQNIKNLYTQLKKNLFLKSTIMYILFFFLLLPTPLLVSSEPSTPTGSTRTLLIPMTFQIAGQQIVQHFINTHPNPITAMNIIHELMTQRDESHEELCEAIGRDPEILTNRS